MMLMTIWRFLFAGLFLRCELGGGGGSTSSQSNQTSTTENIDKRIANGNGGVIATEGSSINIKSIDPEIAKAAFAFATANDATVGHGFDKLLDTATTLSSRFQDNILHAYDQAKASANGTIDQKTMIVLGVTAATALVMMRRK